jgi:RHS repeat-associated protein
MLNPRRVRVLFCIVLAQVLFVGAVLGQGSGTSASPPASSEPGADCPKPFVWEGDLLNIALERVDNNGESKLAIPKPRPIATGLLWDDATNLSHFTFQSGFAELDPDILRALGAGVGGEPQTTGGHGGGGSWPGASLSGPRWNCMREYNPAFCPIAPIWAPGDSSLGDAVPAGRRFRHTGDTLYDGNAASTWTGVGHSAELVYYQLGSGSPTQHIRIKLPSGSIMEFEPLPGTGANNSRTSWRIKRVYDPYDNVMEFTHDSTGRLIRIDYPSGVAESWAWDEDAGTSLSRITVTYDLDGDQVFDEYDAVNPEWNERALRWGMEFEDQGSDDRPFVGARMTRMFYPATPYVTAPDENSLFGTTATVGHLVLQLGYTGIEAEEGGTQEPRVTSVVEYRVANLWDAAPDIPTPIVGIEYQALWGRLRVVTQEDRHTLLTSAAWTFGYTEFWGSASDPQRRAKRIKLTDPRGTETATLLDDVGRKTEVVVTPDGFKGGLPRASEGFGPAEPTSLTWSFSYGGSSCGCGKPTQIVAPGPTAGTTRTTSWTWDSWGFPLTKTFPNPSSEAAPNELTHTWLWSRSPGTSLLGHSATVLTGFTTADGSWTGQLAWAARGTTPGNRLVQQEMTSPSLTDVDGNPIAAVTVKRVFTANGWLSSFDNGDAVLQEFAYAGSNVDIGVPSSVTRATVGGGSGSPEVTSEFGWDSFGRMRSVTLNKGSVVERETLFERDAEGRLLSESTVVSDVDPSGVPQSIDHRREYLRDFWGNVAVKRERNRDSADAAPKRHGGTGSGGRAWIRVDRHYEGDRLFKEFVDRRALDDDETGALVEDPAARMLEYTYTYYPDGSLNVIGLPNGSTRTMTLDGYGTLYSSVVSNGTDSLLEGKWFVDGALDVNKVFRGDATSGPTLWTTIDRHARSGLVDKIIEPEVASAPPGYTGSLGGAERVFVRDRMARVTETSSFEGGGTSPLAKTEYQYDQIGREVGKKEHMLGAGPGGFYQTKRRFAGMTILGEVELPGGRKYNYYRDDLRRVSEIRDSLQPTPNSVTFDYLSGADLIQSRTTALVQSHLGAADTVTSYQTRFTWDELVRLRKIENLGSGGAQVPETHGFWYYTTGDTEWHLRWKGASQPALGSTGIREQRFMPDALGRLVQHTLLGDDGQSTTDDILLKLIHEDWTSASTARTRFERQDGLGNRTVTHYDFAGRPDILQRPGADDYSATKVSDAHTLIAFYDAASRLVSTEHGYYGASPASTDYFWDGPGRLLVRQFANVSSFQFFSTFATREVYERDALGRVLAASTYAGDLGALALATKVLIQQDSIGRVHQEKFDFGVLDLAATDQWTVTSTFDTDLLDRRQSLAYQGGLQMEMRWDDIGRIESVDWNATGSAQLLADYGHFGGNTSWRHLKPKDAVSGTFIDTEYSFDVYGRNSRIQDSRVGSSPASLTDYEFEYDDFGNLVQEEYDRLDGDTLTTNDGDAFYYDRFHRLQEAVLGASNQPFDPGVDTFLKTLTYDLDDAGNRETVATTDSGGSSTETYTQSANRYQTVSSIPETLLWDGRGNLIYDGSYYYVYDFKDRLSEVFILVEDEVVAEQTSLSGAETFRDQQVSAVLPGVESLAAARAAIWAQLGRVPRERRAYDRLQQAGLLTEPVSLPQSALLRTSTGRLTTPQQAAGTTSLQLLAFYVYDPFDRRIARGIVAETYTYLHMYDGWREVEELVVDPATGAKTSLKQFVWGSRLDELVAYRKRTGASTWDVYHATQLGHESITRVLDAQGNVVEKAVYDPYGRAEFYSTADVHLGVASQTGLPIGWKGHRRDVETGLVYMRHRYYSAAWGRFLQLDPIGIWSDRGNHGGGYVYARNQPLNFMDPLGLQGAIGQIGIAVAQSYLANAMGLEAVGPLPAGANPTSPTPSELIEAMGDGKPGSFADTKANDSGPDTGAPVGKAFEQGGAFVVDTHGNVYSVGTDPDKDRPGPKNVNTRRIQVLAHRLVLAGCFESFPGTFHTHPSGKRTPSINDIAMDRLSRRKFGMDRSNFVVAPLSEGGAGFAALVGEGPTLYVPELK